MEEARKLAEAEGVALNQLINVAVAEKLSALRTADYFTARAEASRQGFIGKRRADDGHDDFMQVGEPLNRIGEGLLVSLGILRSDIGGFKLLMFFQDENPPHVHLKGADFAAKIRISNGEILAGDAPRRVLKLARQWIQEHRASLVEQWNEFQR